MGDGINYIEATQIAFLEVFPDVDIGLMPKIKKKIQTHKRINRETPISDSKSIQSQKKKIEKIRRMNILIKKGKKKNITINEMLIKTKFSRTTYYRNRNLILKNKQKINNYSLTNSSKITYEVHDYIFNNLNKTLKELQHEISCLFTYRHPENGIIEKIHISPSTIWRHIQKNKNIYNIFKTLNINGK